MEAAMPDAGRLGEGRRLYLDSQGQNSYSTSFLVSLHRPSMGECRESVLSRPTANSYDCCALLQQVEVVDLG